jgi:hypothetical protein
MYLVCDRGNTPTLGMASGYQRFIEGLALRIAFAQMGATGQNLGHLFIDEGFVACDAFNLDKVNVVLQGMMEYGGYESIMLMSHLDTIRAAADIVIDIERNGVFSYIRPGHERISVMEVAEVKVKVVKVVEVEAEAEAEAVKELVSVVAPTQKRRGRPPKKQ